jgi:predicted ferric reductase
MICGPPSMMKSLKAQLKKIGVKKRNINTEEFDLS